MFTRHLAAAIAIAIAMSATVFTASATAQERQSPPPTDVAPPAKPVRTIAEWSLPKRGQKLAIKGYDPVAYFPEGGGKPLKGSRDITHTHEGVTYRFRTAENRARFIATPGRYEPAHGGWCSWAMRSGEKTEVDPKTFIVSGDRLFLFYNGLFGNTRNSWRKTDHAASAREADARWKRISREEPRAIARTAPTTPPA